MCLKFDYNVAFAYRFADIVFKRFFNVLNQYPRLWSLTPQAWRSRKVIKILHSFTDAVIRDRQKQLKESLSHTSESVSEETFDEFAENTSKKKRFSFLDMLLQATIEGKPLSDLDIREEVDTFMFEGHDTTTSGMTFTAYNMAMHPDIQDRVFEEQRRVMGDDPNATCTISNLQEMKYLDKVIKETLRIHPSVPFIGRVTLEPIQIQGVSIPAGFGIQIPIYGKQIIVCQ